MNNYQVIRKEGDKYTSHVIENHNKANAKTLASYRVKSTGNKAQDAARSKDIVWQLSVINEPVKTWLAKQPDIHLV